MDPILGTFIQSNEPPSEPQALHVRQILDDTLSSLSELEEEVSKVVLSLLKLEKERRLRSEYAATLKGVLSPIRRIPSEILAEIFLLCRDNSLDTFQYSVADPRQAPMLLGHVSSRWRQVSHSSTRLWDHLYIQRNSGDWNPPNDILRSILASSRILPLYVNLQMSGPFSPTGLVDEDVLDPLFQQHHRLKDVRFNFSSINLPSSLCNKRSLPILSSIRIVADENIDIPHLLATFNHAPLMRSVYIDAYNTSTLSLGYALPWSQLTRLVLAIPIEIRQAGDILARCEMMQECQLEELMHSNDLRPSQRVCRLNHLRRFTIYIEDSAPHLELFFEAFSFPTLDYLNIGAKDWSPHILPGLYTRSKFSLVHLELHRIDLDAEDLIRFLRHLPGLRVLHLSYCCSEDALFKAFTDDLSNPIPPLTLPQLESFTVADDKPYLNGAVIADMAESVSVGQNAAFPALKTVHLWLDGPGFDDEVEARLVFACGTGFVIDHLKGD
ncbi:hypothetical protein FB451DRAFT_1466735 [Mycena latifolia]|nr:hypothetical protein FB451DRAFT_1466735 [Mycena latifolia]